MPAEGEDRSARLTRRRLLQTFGLVCGGALVGAAGGQTLSAGRTGHEWELHDRRRPVFGMLQAEVGDYQRLQAAGVGAVTLSVPWSRAQPERGRFDEDHLREVERTHRAARAAGLDVVLSPGLQYPPDWAAELPDARFVDQDGNAWRGGAGDDVLDGLFNGRVRDAQGAYLGALCDRLGDLDLAGVRVGGLARGELHYPPVDRFGARNTLWAYSAPAQARCPVRGWRPGSGDEADARAVVTWYLDELRDYGLWQLELVREHLGTGPRRIVLLPSWGLRPGEVDEAISSGLDGSSSAEQRGTLTEGLDWDAQTRAFARQQDVDVCTTWLDPEDQGQDDRSTSPGRFLAALARERGLRVWGENTGGNDADELRRCFERVRELDLAGLFWMGAAQLGEDGNASLDDYAEAVRR